MEAPYLLLANLILIAHALIVLFNIAALPAIWLGYLRNWSFARSFGFRITHLLLIAFVFAESLLGAICPLTSWENVWRTKAGMDPRYQGGFIVHWVHRLIFYDLDEKYFVFAYGLFLLLVLLTFLWIKPAIPQWLKSTR